MTDAPLDEPNARFTEGERTELESCRYQASPRRLLSVIELATAWALHVRKIDADRTMPPDDPGTWGPHDLVAALYIRDFLADCVSRLSAELRDKVITAIRPYDEMFREVTQPDGEHLVARAAALSLEDRSWWWYRIPDSGPMLDELRAL